MRYILQPGHQQIDKRLYVTSEFNAFRDRGNVTVLVIHSLLWYQVDSVIRLPNCPPRQSSISFMLSRSPKIHEYFTIKRKWQRISSSNSHTERTYNCAEREPLISRFGVFLVCQDFCKEVAKIPISINTFLFRSSISIPLSSWGIWSPFSYILCASIPCKGAWQQRSIPC